MKIMATFVRIVEQPGVQLRWRLHWDASSFEDHETAIAAQKAVAARDSMLIASGAPAVVTQIEWTCMTPFGRTIINAITSK